MCTNYSTVGTSYAELALGTTPEYKVVLGIRALSRVIMLSDNNDDDTSKTLALATDNKEGEGRSNNQPHSDCNLGKEEDKQLWHQNNTKDVRIHISIKRMMLYQF